MSETSLAVTVVGSGYMGKGIAQTLARGGARVTLVDREASVAAAALEAMIADVVLAEEGGLVESGAAAAVRSR